MLFVAESKSSHRLPSHVPFIAPAENPEMIARRAREQEQWTTELRAKREELRLLAAHPLLAATPPPIVVARLLAVAGGAEIPLLEMEFAW